MNYFIRRIAPATVLIASLFATGCSSNTGSEPDPARPAAYRMIDDPPDVHSLPDFGPSADVGFGGS
ncbi:MAG: hypothetical protein JWO48_1635 [Bryobacterales bacterium]|nr:hypothetical protein [Bryobacterales bacterium]